VRALRWLGSYALGDALAMHALHAPGQGATVLGTYGGVVNAALQG
jgi:hypothetical protein